MGRIPFETIKIHQGENSSLLDSFRGKWNNIGRFGMVKTWILFAVFSDMSKW